MRILFFAALRELAGRDSLEWVLEKPSTAEAVWNLLRKHIPDLDRFPGPVLFAINQEYARPGSTVRENDELAVFPPVSGGAETPPFPPRPEVSGDVYAIVWNPIDAMSLTGSLVRPEDGAAVTFNGTVRNQSLGRTTLYLEYEGYEPMALRKMREIGEAIRQKWEVGRIGMIHRLGRIEIGESSVLIVVTAPHRGSAFEACRFAIDTLKKTVPIWKKEYFADGEVWVEGESDRS